MRVYLAGSITGATAKDASNWRDYAKTKLLRHGIHAYSPMRGKESLTEDDFGGGTIPLELDSESKLGGPMNTAVAINMRDYLDCIKADALLVHFLDTPQFSGGTIGEMAWAFSKQIPVIVRCPKVCYYTTHPMISTWITCRVDTVDEGIDCVVSFLLP